MAVQFIAYKNSQIAYYVFGNGPRAVACFHGFGEEAGYFEFLAKYAGNQFSFYCIDLPFHGKTEWKDGLLFTRGDLQEIVAQVIATHLTLQNPNDKLSLLGFSLGGRIALSYFQCVPQKIDKVVLLAPDGLKVNFWYWLATQTWIGNKFFAFTMKKPGWFFGFLKGLNKMKLVNASVFKFVNYYIGDAKIRMLLYNRWTTLRKLKPDLSRIKSLVKKEKIPVRLVYGRHDRIILPSVGEKFKQGMEEQCSINIIESGHQVLHEKHAEIIMDALLH